MQSKKLKVYLDLTALTCLCIGPMVGAGLFALPQNIAQGGGLLAAIISMLLTGVGMYCLTRTFQYLAVHLKQLKQHETSLYSYARNWGGDYAGFCSAWGYWISGWMGNVAYLLMLCSTLNFFVPIFGHGLSLTTFLVSSFILWFIIGICCTGLKFSADLNIFATVLKSLPICLFLFICFKKFSLDQFKFNFTVRYSESLLYQIKQIALVTAWLFVGLEGASVFSAQVRNLRMISTATLLSFLIMFVIYFSIVILPFGLVARQNLYGLAYPPLGSLAQQLSGNVAAFIIYIGLILAVLSAFFSWVLLTVQVPYIAGKVDQLFPKLFFLENKRQVPVGALLITGLCEELYLGAAYFFNFNYLETITIAVTMIIPAYLLSAMEYLKIVWKRRLGLQGLSFKDLMFSFIAIFYGCWLFYSADRYFIYSSILFFVGSLIYLLNRYRVGKIPLLSQSELVVFMVITFIATISCYVLLFLNI